MYFYRWFTGSISGMCPSSCVLRPQTGMWNLPLVTHEYGALVQWPLPERGPKCSYDLELFSLSTLATLILNTGLGNEYLRDLWHCQKRKHRLTATFVLIYSVRSRKWETRLCKRKRIKSIITASYGHQIKQHLHRSAICYKIAVCFSRIQPTSGSPAQIRLT